MEQELEALDAHQSCAFKEPGHDKKARKETVSASRCPVHSLWTHLFLLVDNLKSLPNIQSLSFCSLWEAANITLWLQAQKSKARIV